ncbi:unnamed protein product [Miscanthus lutarioriparius]|uniref:Uncharacterized protein n=1 Tax=Miscanthus lutarioriparius TaxID=422564 RepID=A0A811QLS7_9POAL|nr:unnamed protein product [Miscanthus lutarioriparius]
MAHSCRQCRCPRCRWACIRTARHRLCSGRGRGSALGGSHDFGQPMLPNEARTRPLPPPKPRHQLQLREIAPSESSEVLSSEMKVSGVKRKADASYATTKPTKLQTAARD